MKRSSFLSFLGTFSPNLTLRNHGIERFSGRVIQHIPGRDSVPAHIRNRGEVREEKSYHILPLIQRFLKNTLVYEQGAAWNCSKIP